MDTLEKMKRLTVLTAQAESTQESLNQINDPSFDHFLKFAEPSELDDLRAKVKARYEGYLKEIMEEAKALLGGETTATTKDPEWLEPTFHTYIVNGGTYIVPDYAKDGFLELSKKLLTASGTYWTQLRSRFEVQYGHFRKS